MFGARDVALALGYADPAYAYKTHCKSLILLNYEELGGLGGPTRTLAARRVPANRDGEFLPNLEKTTPAAAASSRADRVKHPLRSRLMASAVSRRKTNYGRINDLRVSA